MAESEARGGIARAVVLPVQNSAWYAVRIGRRFSLAVDIVTPDRATDIEAAATGVAAPRELSPRDRGRDEVRGLVAETNHHVAVREPARDGEGAREARVSAPCGDAEAHVAERAAHDATIAMMSRTVTVKTDKARRDLGYEPEVSVEEGLRRTRAA